MKGISIYGSHAQILDGSKIGDGAKIGDWSNVGNDVEIGDDAVIGNFTRIGKSAKIGHWAKIGDTFRIGDDAVIGHNAHVGNDVTIGDGADIGNRVHLGNSASVGNLANIGYCVRVGDKFECEDVKVIDFFTMANVDGTGRRLHIYVHTKGITVRAGCFKGTLDEFCAKAESEGKYLYSVTVRAAAEAFAGELHRQGKTGGWDK